MNDVKRLAEDHWKYVEQVIRTEWKALDADPDRGLLDNHLQILGFHYKTAFEHGFKHGVRSIENNKEKPKCETLQKIMEKGIA